MPILSEISAPEFELLDDTNLPRRLSDFKGQPMILYFYPADDTPGCTKEACNFRDDYSAYQKAGVTILGVSPNSVKSHVKFREKYQLPFPLLADENHQVCTAYGVWGLKKFVGREYEGVLRTTFLIDAHGKIARVFENVRPSEHQRGSACSVEKLIVPQPTKDPEMKRLTIFQIGIKCRNNSDKFRKIWYIRHLAACGGTYLY